MTVRQLLESTDARELAEWRAYFEIEKELRKEERNPKKPANLSEHIKASFRKRGY